MDQSKQERESVPKVPERAQRRRYATARKLAIVGECLVAGASLAGVAMAQQANSNMVRTQMFIKPSRCGVLFADPKIETRTRPERAHPFRRNCHQSSSETSPLRRSRNMKALKQCASFRICVE